MTVSVIKVNPRAEVVFYGNVILARKGDEATAVLFHRAARRRGDQRQHPAQDPGATPMTTAVVLSLAALVLLCTFALLWSRWPVWLKGLLVPRGHGLLLTPTTRCTAGRRPARARPCPSASCCSPR